jgi:predicted phosphodiesterase
MRIAAIYDIHANLPALEAVIGKIRQEKVDCVVVGGDVLPGPMPRETLEHLQDLDVPVQFIYGNGEVAVLEQLAGKDPAAVPEPYRPIIRWTAEQLGPEHERFLAAWPKTLCRNLPGFGEVLFCHATPRNENECFTRLTPASRLFPVFAGLGAALVVCGHTHMQFDRRVGRMRVVNAGSVGMPFGRSRAQWLLLGPDVALRSTPYDLREAAKRIRSTRYPQAEDFARNSVLHPPSERAMLEVFSRAELK